MGEERGGGAAVGRWGGESVKCERSYISLISHPSLSNLLIKQVLQEVKRCVSRPHEDRWHPSARFEGDKRGTSAGNERERSPFKLVNTKATTASRHRRLWAIKKNTSLKKVCFLLPVSTNSGGTVNQWV